MIGKKQVKLHRTGKIIRKTEVLAKLEETGGLIRPMLLALGLPEITFYDNWRYDDEVVAMLEKCAKIGAENITGLIYKQAMDGDKQSQSMYLKYNPEIKKMGWVEEQKIKIQEEKPLDDKTKEELKGKFFKDI